MQISVQNALKNLKESNLVFLELFKHGTMSAEVYKPIKTDSQQPHDRDEVYIVIAGKGGFYSGGKNYAFQAGDFLFVPAGTEHRFENFTDDFCTWVIFYGPIGGELIQSI